MTNEEARKYHKAFGKHSKIPECCIDFFVYQWDAKEGWRDVDSWYNQAVNAARFGYVPCPNCLATGNRVEIKTCEFECGGDHQADFRPKGTTNAY